MKTGMVTLTMNNAKARLYPTFKEWKLLKEFPELTPFEFISYL